MKKTFLLITMAVAGITAQAQNEQMIPADVTAQFNERYAGVHMNTVNWEREGMNYKAEFALGKKDYDVLFDTTGQWLSSEVEDVSFAELPETVKQGLSKKGYNPEKVRDIEMTENPDQTIYKIEVKDGMMKHHDVYMDDKGNIMKEDC